MDECIDSLGDTQIFSALDRYSGYWHENVEELDKVRTVLPSHHGLHQFTSTSFGLKHAPASSQRVLDTISSSVMSPFALVSPEDIDIFFGILHQNNEFTGIILSHFREVDNTLKSERAYIL